MANVLKAFDKGLATFCKRIVSVGLLFLAFDIFLKIACLGSEMHCLIIVILVLAVIESILNGVNQYLKLKSVEGSDNDEEE